MSDDHDVQASFHITYVSAEPPELFPTSRASGGNTCKKSSIQIIEAKSIHLHRCRSNDTSDECSCQDNLDGLSSSKHRVNDNFTTSTVKFLSLMVSPTLTHKFIKAITSVETNNNGTHNGYQAMPDCTDLLVAESVFRRSIHPCLCHDELLTIRKNTNSNRLISSSYSKSKDIETSILPRLSLYGIITADKDSIFPADVILFQHDNLPVEASTIYGSAKNFRQIAKEIVHYSSLLNHETASDAPWSVIKAFPVRSVSDVQLSVSAQNDCATSASSNMDVNATNRNPLDTPTLPCCPVCLHRIDPTALGLPELKQEHKCSEWCSASNHISDNSSTTQHCANEVKLEPWPPPAQCNACNIICQRGSTLRVESLSESRIRGSALSVSPASLACHQCGMTTTLWVCLTCGVVGCGRYTLKHAADHFTSTGHPYSLELATMRIWDYKNGSFVHRRDLLECPVLSMKWSKEGKSESQSLQFTSPLIASSQSGDVLESRGHQFLKNEGGLDSSPRQSELFSPHNNVNASPPSCQNNLRQNLVPDLLSNQPKKSLMISQEYEALLQSALEDQAMHFEGEISHLRAQLASSRVKNFELMSDKEAREINALRKDSERLKGELENLSLVLLESQTEEIKSRALSQKLLREQSVSKELLERLRKDISAEHESCRQQMDELDMEIEDLTANMQMRSQIARSEELSQAQIVGTVGGARDSSGNKKKSRKSRFGRKK